MVSLCRCKWIWIPLIVLSMLAIVESEKKRDKVLRLSRRNRQPRSIVEKNNLDLATNHIPPRKKRSSHVNDTSEEITTITAHVLSSDNKKTLLDLEKPALLNEFAGSYDFEESSNETRVRVKRTDTNFDESDNPKSFMQFDNSNYIDSFPRSSDKQRWSFEKRRAGLSTQLNDNDISNTLDRRNLTINSEVIPSCSNITEEASSPIDSRMRIKREKKSNKNRRRILHGKKKKLKKHVGKGVKKKGASSNRAGKRLSNSSKVSSALKGERKKEHAARNNLLNVIDDYQVESRIEKRDSSDDRSEVEVAKRDVSRNDEELLRKGTRKEEDEGAAIDEAQRDKRSLRGNAIASKNGESSRFSGLNLKNEKSRAKRNGSNDSIFLKSPNESTSSSLSISSENEIEVPAERSRDNRAVKSIEAIKELAEKLVTKVNELQNYLTSDDQGGGKAKKKLESREIEVPRDNVTNLVDEEEEEVVLEAPKLVDECVRIGDLSSALKNLEDRNVSLEKSTSKDEVGTERIGLSSDRTSPLAKRMARKSRIKRKSRRKWGRWTGWSSCSVTCGKGRQIRWRHCLRDCSTVETEMEEKTCQLPACPPGKFLGIF